MLDIKQMRGGGVGGRQSKRKMRNDNTLTNHSNLRIYYFERHVACFTSAAAAAAVVVPFYC